MVGGGRDIMLLHVSSVCFACILPRCYHIKCASFWTQSLMQCFMWLFWIAGKGDAADGEAGSRDGSQASNSGLKPQHVNWSWRTQHPSNESKIQNTIAEVEKWAFS